MDGLEGFDGESRAAIPVTVGDVTIPVLPLRRIIASKKATGREKDRAMLPALADTLRAIESES